MTGVSELNAALTSLLGFPPGTAFRMTRALQVEGLLPISVQGRYGTRHLGSTHLIHAILALGAPTLVESAKASVRMYHLPYIEHEVIVLKSKGARIETWGQISTLEGATLGQHLESMIEKAATHQVVRESMAAHYGAWTLRLCTHPAYAVITRPKGDAIRVARFGLSGRAPELAWYHRDVTLPLSLFITAGELLAHSWANQKPLTANEDAARPGAASSRSRQQDHKSVRSRTTSAERRRENEQPPQSSS